MRAGEVSQSCWHRGVAEESITISAKDGERMFARSQVRRVKVPSPGRRVLHGAIGIGVGVLLGVLSCPSCANEGAEEIVSRNVGIGAGLGSLAFLIPGYRTIYKGPKRASGVAKVTSLSTQIQ